MPALVRNAAPNGVALVLSSTAQISTADSVFGGGSLFTNANGAFALALSGTLDLRDIDSTVEWRCRAISTSQSFPTLFDFGGTQTGFVGWGIFCDRVNRTLNIFDSVAGSTVISTPVNSIPAPGPSSNWWAGAVSVQSNLMRVFINGSLAASGTFNPRNTHSSGVKIGDNRDNVASFSGYIDEVRITRTVARYTSNYTVSPVAFPENADDDPHWNNVVALCSFDQLFSPPTKDVTTPGRKIEYPLPAFSARGVERIQMPYRVYNGGRGKIYGTVKIKGTPTVPTSRAVRLFRDIDSMCLAETWSDPVTGYYEFIGFDLNQKYTVVAIDYQNNYRAVIADNLTAEIV